VPGDECQQSMLEILQKGNWQGAVTSQATGTQFRAECERPQQNARIHVSVTAAALLRRIRGAVPASAARRK
jgi:hypothetical protein